MPNLTTVGLTAGAATSGTGTVSTLDNVIGVAGTPSAQVQTVQGVTSMTPLKVDGSATTQPVSGTVTANIGTGITKAAGAADATTTRVTIDTGQIGSLVTGDFTKATATVPVELPSDQAPIATKDAGPNWTSVWGVAGVPVTTATTFSTTAVTDAPTSTQKLCIDDIIVSSDAATKITLLEETSGTVMFGPWYLPANSGPMQISIRGKKKLVTADKKLVATSVGSANMTVQVGYHSEA